ncbi:MAG TPA: hypothetical protein VG675_05415 [Bryobacteraceae bacterium]|nr:hypothetical protein [Bryobacteraceae bacterium]
MADDGGNSNYNAMLASVQHRFSHNFTLLANYTWGHCIIEGDFNGDLRGAYYQNPFDRGADRGDCNYDLRQIFNASFVAVTPKGSSLASKILGNWQFAPLIRATSGGAINVTSGKDNSFSAENLDRPNRVAGTPIYNSSIGPQLAWLNPAALSPIQPEPWEPRT